MNAIIVLRSEITNEATKPKVVIINAIDLYVFFDPLLDKEFYPIEIPNIAPKHIPNIKSVAKLVQV